ncbi:MAG: DUF2520 domain-containing protein [Acidobacteria bacterium]|nr:DUF2520 domain-containing protein [Acidobacteriota bacterium]
MPSTPRLAFVGAGRVARALSKAFDNAGIAAATVSSRNPGEIQSAVERSDWIFLTVADHAIETVCTAIQWPADKLAIHTSGAHDLDVLQAAPHRASFHPMQSFPQASLSHALAPGITISIEASGEDAARLEDLARRIGGNPLRLPPGARPLYHASGYFASPLLVTMLHQAAGIWAAMGFEEKTALATLLPLLKETVRMIEDHGLENSLTGLVVRGDAGTLRRHLDHLRRSSPETAGHYAYLTAVSINLAESTGGITAGQAQLLRAALSDSG